MPGFPTSAASKNGNLIVNPGSSTPGALETYLREPRWWALGLGTFRGFPALRGGHDDNAVIPGVEGRFALEPVIDQGTYVTGIRVTGSSGASGVEPSGVAETRFLAQLDANLDYLWANVGSPGSAVTREARLIRASGATINFDAQFRLTWVEQKIAEASLMLDVTVPDGRIE